MSHVIVRSWVLLVAVAAMVAATAAAALAHSGEESYVYLSLFDEALEGEVHYPIPDLNEVLGLELDRDSETLEDELAAVAPEIGAYTAANLGFFAEDGTPWPVTVGETRLLVTEDGYAVTEFVVDETFDAVPRTFDVEYSAVVTEKPERSALLIIATDFGSGTFNNEAEHLLVYDGDSTRNTVDLGDTSFISGVTGTIWLGAEHIQIGFDHILFILALVLPSVLVFRRRDGWTPAQTFGGGLWRVVKIATSFTVAHTITLTLGGLGLVELPGEIVEPIIAISIALAALHNIRPLFFNKEWALAFAFGLFHGFGFAGLLGDLGLTRSNRIVSLLGFNIGIELGQVVVILLVFPSLFLLRRTRAYVGLMNAGSVGLILVSTGWFLERVFDIDLGATWLMDRLLVWPRPLALAAALLVFAVGFWAYERSQDRLIPLDGGRPDADEDDLQPLVTAR